MNIFSNFTALSWTVFLTPFVFHLFTLYLGWFPWSSGDEWEAPPRLLGMTLLSTIAFLAYGGCFALLYFGAI